MARTRIVSSLICGVIVAGCAERSIGGSDASAETSGGETGTSGAVTTGESPTGGGDPGTPTGDVVTSSQLSGTSTGADPSTGGTSSDTEHVFIVNPDGGDNFCDPFVQDCPEGQKCMPWAKDGGNVWNSTKCVDVTGDQKPGEPCMTDGGGVSGNDDCVKGAMCWDVNEDDVGTCVAQCTGTSDTPICAEGFNCAITSRGVLNICLPACDPLVQDCPGDDLCLPVNETFWCVLDASGDEGQVFDPCEFANACDPGLVCAGSASASECDPLVTGCCVPMCSISGMMVCPGVEQECTSLYEEGMAPPEYAEIGYCTLPV